MPGEALAVQRNVNFQINFIKYLINRAIKQEGQVAIYFYNYLKNSSVCLIFCAYLPRRTVRKENKISGLSLSAFRPVCSYVPRPLREKFLK